MVQSKQDATTVRPPTFGDSMCEGTIPVEVGPDRRKYHVHKALLTYHSEYFKKALQGSWQEAKESTVTLENVEPGVFNIFVRWLHTQNLPQGHTEWKEVIQCEYDGVQFQITKLKAYAFGDRILAPSFRRTIHNNFIDG